MRASQRLGRTKAALTAAFFSIILVLASASVSAVDITYSNFRWQDSTLLSERYFAVDIVIKDTVGASVIEKGILEFGLSTNPKVPPYLGIFRQEKPCNDAFPWNVHNYYEVSGLIIGQDETRFTLIGRSITDGTYYPVLTHATGCFSGTPEQQALQAKTPYGFGYRITSSPIIFGQGAVNINDQCGPSPAIDWVRNHGDPSCRDAACDNPESGYSVARCTVRNDCVNGAEQWTTCADGKSIAVRRCQAGAWQQTGSVCAGQTPPAEPAPTTPETVNASLGGGVPLGKVLIIIGSVLGVVWLFRRFGRRFM